MSALAHKRAKMTDKENRAPFASSSSLGGSAAGSKRGAAFSVAAAESETSGRVRKVAKYTEVDDDGHEMRGSARAAARDDAREGSEDEAIEDLPSSKRAAGRRADAVPAKTQSRKAVLPAASMEDEEEPTLREIELQEQVNKLTGERDAVQGEFDALRELRYTAAEKSLAELKRAAEQRRAAMQEKCDALGEEIAVLRRLVESAEKGSGGASASARPSMAQAGATQEVIAELEEELDRERSERKKTQKELNLLRLEYEAEVASSKKLLTGGGASAAAGAAGVGLAEEEKAVRTLYEDLTGMIIRSVARQDDTPEDFKTFNGLFAGSGYYDVQFSIEESQSEHASSSGSARPRKRDDLVFIANLDADRDAELLHDERVPSYLKDVIRFERASGPKFLGALLKGMKRP